MTNIEYPIFNTHGVAKYILSKGVNEQGYKCCLTGEGADEVFSGYPYHVMENIFIRGGNKAFHKFLKQENFSKDILWLNPSKKEKRLSIDAIGYVSYFYIRVMRSKNIAKKLFTNSYNNVTESIMRNLSNQHFINADLMNRSTRKFTINQLASYVLIVLGDRVEMANSVECRTPFLDNDLTKFSFSLPKHYFIEQDSNKGKHILYDVSKEIFSTSVIPRRKHPFLAPLWQNILSTNAGKELASQYLSKEAFYDCGVYDHKEFFKTVKYGALMGKYKEKSLSSLIGAALTVNIMHSIFIKNNGLHTNKDFNSLVRV